MSEFFDEILMANFAKQIDRLIKEPFVTILPDKKGVRLITIRIKEASKYQLTVYHAALQNWRFRLLITDENVEVWSALTPWKNPYLKEEE